MVRPSLSLLRCHPGLLGQLRFFAVFLAPLALRLTAVGCLFAVFLAPVALRLTAVVCLFAVFFAPVALRLTAVVCFLTVFFRLFAFLAASSRSGRACFSPRWALFDASIAVTA